LFFSFCLLEQLLYFKLSDIIYSFFFISCSQMTTPMSKDDEDIPICPTCDGCDDCTDCVCHQTLVGCSMKKCSLNYLCFQCHTICPVCHNTFCNDCFTKHCKVHTPEQLQKAKEEHVRIARELTERAAKQLNVCSK